MFYKVYSVLAKKFNLSTLELFLNQVTEKYELLCFKTIRKNELLCFKTIRK